jgi:succinyl-diaminopimelate desuccinylase
MIDLVSLCQQLIRCPSITPGGRDCLDIIAQILTTLGYEFVWQRYGDVHNLIATHPKDSGLCFVGHVDVVPVEGQSWTCDPFGGQQERDIIYGRGAVDMKGAIAAFIYALCQGPLSQYPTIVLTTDEEGAAIDGVQRVAQYFDDQHRRFSMILIGEPTSKQYVGDTIKMGRRGSLNGQITVSGVGGHVAYPNDCSSPVPLAASFLAQLQGSNLDEGFGLFPPSHVEITGIETHNKATNIIPTTLYIQFNIRYNPCWSHKTLCGHIEQLLKKESTKGVSAKVHWRHPHAEVFSTQNVALCHWISGIIEKITGSRVMVSTDGGTSDGRFLHHFGPIVELGLCHRLAHQADEFVTIGDLFSLASMYESILIAWISMKE